ncbi:hypothetical protein [Nocardioides cynanchi]|uniref:hypothetical protein n=1 Tax=Nocardioides cynanchi TaxID=2558918 RepID=UPI00124937A4|nr:hypothetical protein [Nocardioides cynanchi]
MSMRGLVVALLCGLLGLGGGALVAYAVQPHTHDAGSPRPVGAVSPSVPIDVRRSPSHAPDITYPTLPPDLPLQTVHTIKNRLATWTYHVPEGWTPYAACPPAPATCKIPTDTVLKPGQVDRQRQLVFRPPGEPTLGGYLMRVAVLDNTLSNVGQMVATKIVGFEQQQAATREHFKVLKQTPYSVYFRYNALPSNRLRYNYFQWFAVPGQPNATLEMSVAGRQSDVPGLKALFNRFADNASGS